jgi:microcystin degradation protein MlrC
MAHEVVLVGSFKHESNTFSPEPTDRSQFQERIEYFGEEVTERLRGTNTEVGGAIDVAEAEDVELIQTVAASATPGGPVPAETYEFYSERILDGVREHADDLDGVLLPLHGAMVPEGMDDGEGPLIAAVREEVGEDVPIVATLDLHGNLTDQMIDASDALIGFETYPHVDMCETGRRGMRILLDAVRGETDPVNVIERPPVLAYGPLQNTQEGPMARVMAKAREFEERDGVVKVSVFPGFYSADIPSMGCSVPVVTDGDPELGREIAREMAEYIWGRREEFVGDFPEPAEAVARATELAADLGDDDGPVVMADVGDNPGGGGTADTTPVLRELLDQAVTDAGFAIMHDPEVVEQCVAAGVGEPVTVTVGAKKETDAETGDPIEDLDGYVKAITDGEFVNTGPMGTGTENHLGQTVQFVCGGVHDDESPRSHEDGVSVIVTENRMQPLDAEIWRHVGIQPERLGVLVVKSTNHYRADYEPMSSHVVPINSPGLYPMDPTKYTYTRVRRPQFPLDEMADDDYPDW